jgi:tetratricopeptide (TPR) repeat protein
VRLPGDPEVTYHVGMAQYYLGQEDSARQSFKSVVTASTNAPVKLDAAARLVILDIDPGQATPAIRSQLDNVVRTDPNDPIALLRLAAIGSRDGRLPEAAGHYEAALKIYPRNTAAMLALAELYFGPLQKPERAKELAKQARDAAPNDDQIAWKLGRLLYTAGEFAWANGLLQDAARGMTGNSEILYDLALSQYSVGRVPETAAALEKILALVPPPANRSPAARLAGLLNAASRTPLDGNALAEARRILAEDPNHVPALMLTAVAQEQEKKPEEAYRSYERVLTVYPQFVPAMRQLAILSGEQLADDDKTEEWSRKTLKLLPDDPDANFQIGVVSYRRGNYEDAVRFLNQCIRHRNDSASAYFFLGMSYFQLKNGSECGVALKRALQLKLPPQEANEAMRILDALARRRGNL